ncbi:hypothetical protein [Pseudoalteromonas sp. R3]|uniref:hypothetical protein n=1 Tax=Pseudoalteromonas sp. R3 TaxID=1709477 RepID=UPI0006B47824|nr:hypothetical protein [Pseudoalteromonas sp. R3]AZZ99912.1 hypothetical protein ELR70_24290 [Pseudoalteromonas sp. R3]
MSNDIWDRSKTDKANAALFGNFVWMTINSSDLKGILQFMCENVEVEDVHKTDAKFDTFAVYNAHRLILAKLDQHIYLGGFGLPSFHESARPDNLPYYVAHCEKQAVKNNMNLLGALANALSSQFGETHYYAMTNQNQFYFWLKSIRGKLDRLYAFELNNSDEYLSPGQTLENTVVSFGSPTEIELALSKEYFIEGLSEPCAETQLPEINLYDVLRRIPENWDVHPYKILPQFQDAYLIELSVPAFSGYRKFIGIDSLCS